MLALLSTLVLSLCTVSPVEESVNLCPYCKLAVGMVFPYLEKVEQYLPQVVGQICSLLPKEYEALCSSVLETEITTVVNWVLESLDADRFCALLTLCPDSGETKEIACELCDLGFDGLEKLLTDKEVVSMLKELIEKICDLIPSPQYKALCDTFIAKNLESYIKMILENYPPEVICKYIGACIA